MKLEEHNARNAATRQRITFQKWTEIAAACQLCTQKTAPLLSRLIFETCDLRKRGVEGGFFDGPQAYGILLENLPGEENRTRAKRNALDIFHALAHRRDNRFHHVCEDLFLIQHGGRTSRERRES